MISRVNEAFQECFTTSWYGGINTTYHWKRKLGPKSGAGAIHWLSTNTQRETFTIAECFPVEKVRSPCRELVHVHVRGGRFRERAMVVRTEDRGHLITPQPDAPYKCFKSWIHAGCGAGDNRGQLNNAKPAYSHYTFSGFKRRTSQVCRESSRFFEDALLTSAATLWF